MQKFRSIVFTVAMMVTATVYSTLVVLAMPLPFRMRSGLGSTWARLQMRMLKWLCGLDYAVEGREHIPAGAAILYCKHQSAWETIALQCVFGPQTWVMKRELLWVPIFGWALGSLRSIAIDRGAGRSARDQVIERGTDRLRDGINVVFFPEGSRLPPRTEKRFGQGGALLATASGAPVVPIAHNAGSYWPRRSITKKPGTIRMMIGPAVDPAGMTAQQLNELIHDWMRETMAGLEGTNPRTTDNKPILEAPRQ